MLVCRRPVALALPGLAVSSLLAACAGNTQPVAQPVLPPPAPVAAPASAPRVAAPRPGATHAAVRENEVVAGGPARVFVMAGLGDGCRPVGPPTIQIEQQPAKGAVSLRPGQETTIKTSGKGDCLGQRAVGTGIYYTARAGEKGSDTFTVSARLGDDAPVKRTFTVQIAD